MDAAAIVSGVVILLGMGEQATRNAIELIVEEKADARDPEHADDTVK